MKEQYELPQYSRSKIEKAGKIISKYEENSDEFQEFLPVVDNWRAAHAYALDCIAEKVNEAMHDDDFAYVVRRLKRRESIIAKLKRSNNTGLYRMQDLGGCRVIVEDLDKVYKAVERIKQYLTDYGHEIVGKEYDYISVPRSVSGYRSYHLVVRFHCDEEPLFDGMIIEIQIRTRLEHVWATAVEMMDIISEETLKAGTGKMEYMRFFKLVSALFSIAENTPIVEGVVNNEREIIEEILEIDKTEHIRDKLASYNQAIQVINTNRSGNENYGYYLLKISRLEHTISITPFEKENVDKATKEYQELEKHRKENDLDLVLISVGNLNILKEAYPNYFLLTYDFLSCLARLCFTLPEKSKIRFSTRGKGMRIAEVFSMKYIDKNVPSGIRVPSDTLGVSKGEIYIIPSKCMTLDDSYLRFSTPIWNEFYSKEDESIGTVEIAPQVVLGPGIVVTETGGCFYCEKKNWCFICSERALLIQSKNKDNDSLLFLLSWMKSNVFIWDLLWNYHSITALSESVINNIWLPEMQPDDYEMIVSTTKKIITLERKFTKSFVDDGFESQMHIIEFNQMISRYLVDVETIYEKYYGINSNEKKIIQQELSIKGYYTYV